MYPTGQKRDLDFLRTKFLPFYEGENGRYNNYHLLMWDG